MGCEILGVTAIEDRRSSALIHYEDIGKLIDVYRSEHVILEMSTNTVGNLLLALGLCVEVPIP